MVVLWLLWHSHLHNISHLPLSSMISSSEITANNLGFTATKPLVSWVEPQSKVSLVTLQTLPIETDWHVRWSLQRRRKFEKTSTTTTPCYITAYHASRTRVAALCNTRLHFCPMRFKSHPQNVRKGVIAHMDKNKIETCTHCRYLSFKSNLTHQKMNNGREKLKLSLVVTSCSPLSPLQLS